MPWWFFVCTSLKIPTCLSLPFTWAGSPEWGLWSFSLFNVKLDLLRMGEMFKDLFGHCSSFLGWHIKILSFQTLLSPAILTALIYHRRDLVQHHQHCVFATFGKSQSLGSGNPPDPVFWVPGTCSHCVLMPSSAHTFLTWFDSNYTFPFRWRWGSAMRSIDLVMSSNDPCPSAPSLGLSYTKDWAIASSLLWGPPHAPGTLVPATKETEAGGPWVLRSLRLV